MGEALKKETIRIKEREYPHIVCDPNIKNGMPIVKGTATTVRGIVENYYSLKMSVDEIKESLPQLTEADIHAAVLYYLDHKEEIDEDIRDNNNIEK